MISLDVSACSKLRNLKCETNEITSITFNKNNKLESINCSDNLLTSLTLTSKFLHTIKSNYCELNTLTLPDSLPELEVLECKSNNLSSLTIKYVDHYYFKKVDCSENQLTYLNFSHMDIDALIRKFELICTKNKISCISISDVKKVNDLNFKTDPDVIYSLSCK